LFLELRQAGAQIKQRVLIGETNCDQISHDVSSFLFADAFRFESKRIRLVLIEVAST
jgi:hypothetical protein